MDIMTSAIGISLTGLDAASLRLAVSADNVANAETTSKENGPYIPKDVVQISQQLGGTQAVVKNSDKAPVTSYDPGNLAANSDGLVQLPNVDLAEEAVNQLEASISYKANLQAISNQKNIFNSLFDIFA
jgi:flagellar basal-body rod protein FlgC